MKFIFSSNIFISLFYQYLITLNVLSIELPSNCGKNKNVNSPLSIYKFHERIIGGHLSKKGQWPWQVYLNKTVFYNGMTIQDSCGASILNKDWILTAAHCVNDVINLNQSGIKVNLQAVFGSIDLIKKTNDTVERKITKLILHENFDFEAMINDIALLKLDTSLELDGYDLSPVCLTNLTNEFFQHCFVSGFGFQDKNFLINDFKLRNIPESIYNIQKCIQHFPYVNNQTNICVGGIAGHGTCLGDSGSPMQCLNSIDKRWYQIGLVSYGEPCALPNIPDVFTRVSYFYDWIKQKE